MKDLAQRVGQLLGSQPVRWQRRAASWQPADSVPGGNERFSVLLDDGRWVFVKAATSAHLAAALRREAEVYAHLHGAFMPALIAFEDDPIRPVLVLEDLGGADWSVDWTSERVAAVRATLRSVASSSLPPATPPVRSMLSDLERWSTVRNDPAPFLSSGVRSAEWLDKNIAALEEAAVAAPIDGDELLHFDVRSDNLCFRDGAAILVDWNWSSIGRAEFDVAAWLPSLALEGGPAPWQVLPHAGDYAALLAGAWAAVVGLPPPATAPTVRDMQRRQLTVALAWAEHELALV
jgi:hypothetical protein